MEKRTPSLNKALSAVGFCGTFSVLMNFIFVLPPSNFHTARNVEVERAAPRDLAVVEAAPCRYPVPAFSFLLAVHSDMLKSYFRE